MTPDTAVELWATMRAGAELTRWTGRLPSIAEARARVGRVGIYAELSAGRARVVEAAHVGEWPVLRAAWGEDRSTIAPAVVAAAAYPTAVLLDARRDPCPAIYTPPGMGWSTGCDAIEGHIGPHSCAHVELTGVERVGWTDDDPGAER